MNVSAPFIARPVATSLLALAVLILGVLGFRALPVGALPQVDFPTIAITTQLPGADPETMAALVTAPLERQLGLIPSLAHMTSTSSFGLSRITLQFDLARDIDGAAQDVQAAISSAGSALPRGLPYPPVYAKINPADAPIMTLALTSKTLQRHELSDVADTLIAQRLSEVTGVGSVSVQGGLKPAIRVQADLEVLAALGLGLEDLRRAITSASVAAPKGSLDGALQAYTIAANDQITRAEDYGGIVVAFRNGAAVHLRDVAAVIDGFENERIGAWHGLSPAVVIDVRKQPGANTVETATRLRAQLPRLQRALPADAVFTVVSDRTDTIRASIEDVEFTLVLSIVLVILVVVIFLHSWRATLIVGVALPLSLIATFAVMWLAGFSLNNLSLMALTIGTGFVVDDVIVMIENITRHIENGEDANIAANSGSREIGFTVISLTASLLAVFIPMLFMTGIVGRMFREFALTLSIAVVVSAIVSLTLTPMMCARLLRSKAPGGAHAEAEPKSGIFGRAYAWSLRVVLSRRPETLMITAATVAATVALYIHSPKGFLPPQDTGLINLVFKSDPDVSFTELARLQGQVMQRVLKDPDVADAVSVAGSGLVNPTPNTATLTITLKPHHARVRTAADIADAIEATVSRIPGVTPYARPLQDVQIATRASFSSFQYTLAGTSARDVQDWGRKFITALRQDTRFRNVSAVEEDQGFATTIDVDRVRAGQFGVSMQAISDVLNNAFTQRQIATIYGQANQYRVVLEAAPRFRESPASLGAVRLPASPASQATQSQAQPTQPLQPTSGAGHIPLTAIARVTRTAAPLAISHQEQFPSFTVGFDLAPGVSLEEGIDAITQVRDAVGVPPTLSDSFAGEAAEFRDALASQPWLILAAVITIYIVLGILYESYIHPITILSTLPSAGIGAVLALQLMGQQLTIIGVIGIILLMGIVKKNAIMMIDFAIDAERVRGLTPHDAIVEACRLRFRPIMMTTLAALFGALPLALATGPGAELRVPLGVSIVGGLLLSQILTLYTTPVIYLTLDGIRRRMTGEARA